MGRSHDVVQLLSPRPHTALALPLPPPFSHSQHLSVPISPKSITSRPSFQGVFPSEICSSSARHDTILAKDDPPRWKYENKLTRTLTSGIKGVERMVNRFTSLSLPRPRLPESSSRPVSTCGTKRSLIQEVLGSGHGATRPTRSQSKRYKRSHSTNHLNIEDMSNFVAISDEEASAMTTRNSRNIVPQVTTVNPADLEVHLSGGAGARAAAAQHKKSNQNLNQLCGNDNDFEEFLTRDQLAFDNSPETASWADSMDLGSVEDVTMPDPVTSLPTEIVWMIFSKLDVASLFTMRDVSHAWRAQATASAVWKDLFLSKFAPNKAGRSSYLQIGGQGLGKLSRVPQEWESMTKARMNLDESWKAMNPAAIYFCGHTDSVYCCQFDEEKIISGSRDRTIRVWDLKTKKCLKVIGGPQSKPLAVPSDQAILDVHPNMVENIKSLNGTPEGDALFHVPSYYHCASILCLQFDDKIMVTGSSDNTCIVWDIETWEPIAHLRQHRGGVLDVCFDADYIVSCSKDHTICVWSRETYELVKVLVGHEGPVNAVQMRGDKLVSASGDGFSKLWSMQDFRCVQSYASKDRGLAAVEFSDDGKWVLAGGNDQVIYKYDADTRELLHSYKGHTNLVRSLFLDCNNNRVISGSYDQGIRVYDFESGAEMGSYSNWTTSWILAAKSDYRRIVATSQDGRLLMMDFGHGIPNIDLLSSV